MTVSARAVDLTFAWDQSLETFVEGYELRVYSDAALTQRVAAVDVPGLTQTEKVVPLDKGRYYVTVYCYTTVQNPDGTSPKLFSEPSNVLEVKIAGNSGNVRVVKID